MNKERRKAISDVLKDLATQRGNIDEAKGYIEALKGRLEEIKDEEQEYLDNMPESFQQGEKGQRAEEAVSRLDDADTAAANVDGTLGDAIESLQTDVIDLLEQALGEIDEIEDGANAAIE